MRKIKGLKGVILTLLFAGLLVAIFHRLSNKPSNVEEDVSVKSSAVDIVMERNLSTNYPSTPKEVVKYFSEITKCYYNETFKSDEELVALADKMLLLYDDELVSYKTHEDYILDLKSDINYYNENGYLISSYTPSVSTDVEYFTEDGFEWARLWCLYTIKTSDSKFYKTIQEVFILRKDEKSHWRIYGWDLVDEG